MYIRTLLMFLVAVNILKSNNLILIGPIIKHILSKSDKKLIKVMQNVYNYLTPHTKKVAWKEFRNTSCVTLSRV